MANEQLLQALCFCNEQYGNYRIFSTECSSKPDTIGLLLTVGSLQHGSGPVDSGHHYWKHIGKLMIAINNVQPLSAAQLTDILKTEFPDYINAQLGSNLAVEFAHVSDFVNVSFPEVIEGNAYTITVDDDNIELTDHTTDGAYNAELLEQQLIAFLTLKAG